MKRKSLKKVDLVLYLLLASYAIVAFSYFVFELVKINYSPLSTPTELKPSYPSSHVMFFMVILGVNLFGLFHYVKMGKTLKIAVYCCVIALFAAMVVLRLLSGHHYFTDIVGAIFISFNLLSVFDFLTRTFLPKTEE